MPRTRLRRATRQARPPRNPPGPLMAHGRRRRTAAAPAPRRPGHGPHRPPRPPSSTAALARGRGTSATTPLMPHRPARPRRHAPGRASPRGLGCRGGAVRHACHQPTSASCSYGSDPSPPKAPLPRLPVLSPVRLAGKRAMRQATLMATVLAWRTPPPDTKASRPPGVRVVTNSTKIAERQKSLSSPTLRSWRRPPLRPGWRVVLAPCVPSRASVDARMGITMH